MIRSLIPIIPALPAISLVPFSTFVSIPTIPMIPTLLTMPLNLCALVIILSGNVLALALLQRRPHGWKWRREIQLFILAAPLVGLLLGWIQASTCSGPTCMPAETAMVSLAPMMTFTGQALTVAMTLVALGALLLGGLRAFLLPRLAVRRTLPADPLLQQRANRLAAALGLPSPRVLVRISQQPLALTLGLRRPTVLLSTWMVQQLDHDELNAVLAHELAHAARQDYGVLWLAKVLADAFFYLPTSRMAYRLLQTEKEVCCDDLALTVTRRPLGLASALAKVWQYAMTPPQARQAVCAGQSGQSAHSRGRGQGYLEHLDRMEQMERVGQHFVSPAELMEGRITRLLEAPAATDAHGTPEADEIPAGDHQSLRMTALRVGSLLIGTGVLVTLMLVVMGCSVL